MVVDTLSSQLYQQTRSQHLSKILNDVRIKAEAFTTRLLWDRIAGNKNRGCVLYNIIYWFISSDNYPFKPTVWDEEDQCYRVWQSSKQLEEKTGLSAVTIDRYVREFQEDGILNYKVWRNDFGDPIRHFAVNYDKLFTAIANATKCSEWSFHKMIKTYRSFRSKHIYISNEFKKENNIEQEPKNSQKNAIALNEQEAIAIKDYLLSVNQEEQVKSTIEKLDQFENNNSPDVEQNFNKEISNKKDTPAPVEVSDNEHLRSPIETTQDKNSIYINSDTNLSTNEPPHKHKRTTLRVGLNIFSSWANWIGNAIATVEYKRVITKKEKKEMARHSYRDKYFNNSEPPLQQVQKIAQANSSIGMSRFTNMLELEACEEAMICYYKRIYDFETAEKKVAKELDKARYDGKHSILIREFLEDEVLGSRYKEEYEDLREILLPIFEAYLRHDIRKDGDTPTQVGVKVFWFKKNKPELIEAWNKCKQIIAQAETKIKQCQSLGIDLTNAGIPEFYLEVYRPETRVEDILHVDEIMGAVATVQTDAIAKHQKALEPKFDIVDKLPEGHKILKLLEQKKVLEVSQPNDIQKRLEVDSQMDAIADEAKILNSIPNAEEIAQAKEHDQSIQAKITTLLSDPITREEGRQLAKKNGYPILYDAEAEAIAIDYQAIKNTSNKSNQHKYDEGHGVAHEIYTSDNVKKASKLDWKAARARLSFLKNKP